MNILERVKKLNWDAGIDVYEPLLPITIASFLKAAAEQGWHMRPDEATEGMARRTFCFGKGKDAYRAMLAAAPEFEWDK